MRPQKINAKGLQIIKDFESCQLWSYLCPAMKWTIGFGHCGETVGPNQHITQEFANQLLEFDCNRFEACIIDAVKVELNSNQFSALVSLVFNIGCQAFRDSTLLKKINSGDFINCPDEFLRWNKVKGQEFIGLTKRRKAERELWLTAFSDS